VAPSRSRAAEAASGFKSIRYSRSAAALAWAFQHGRPVRHPRSSCVYLTQPAMASSSRTIDVLDVIPARSVWCPVALAGGGEQGAAARGLQACALTESALFFGQPQGCMLALVKAL